MQKVERAGVERGGNKEKEKKDMQRVVRCFWRCWRTLRELSLRGGNLHDGFGGFWAFLESNLPSSKAGALRKGPPFHGSRSQGR